MKIKTSSIPTETLAAHQLTHGAAYTLGLKYAKSGSGKTHDIGEVARFVHDRWGLKTRLYSVSGGGWGSAQEFVDLGWLDPINPMGYISEDTPWDMLDVVSLICEGYWPRTLSDMPFRAEGQGFKKNWVSVAEQGEDWKRIGAVCFEDATEFADLLMLNLTNRQAIDPTFHVVNIGTEVSGSYKSKTGEFGFGRAGQGHFGEVQRQVYKFVKKTGGLDDKVVVWTAIPRFPESNYEMIGPFVAGGALKDKFTQWFNWAVYGDTKTVSKPDQADREEHVLYLRTQPVQETVGGQKLKAIAKINMRPRTMDLDGKPLPPEEAEKLAWPAKLVGDDKAHLGYLLEMMEERRLKPRERK